MPATRAEVLELYRSGKTTLQIAALLGINRTTVSRMLRKEGAGACRYGPRGRIEVADETIVELLNAGESQHAVAAAVGMSRGGIRHRYAVATGKPYYSTRGVPKYRQAGEPKELESAL